MFKFKLVAVAALLVVGLSLTGCAALRDAVKACVKCAVDETKATVTDIEEVSKLVVDGITSVKDAEAAAKAGAEAAKAAAEAEAEASEDEED